MKIVQLLNRRRKDLLPLHLSTMQQSSIPASALAMVVVLLGLSGCRYQGSMERYLVQRRSKPAIPQRIVL